MGWGYEGRTVVPVERARVMILVCRFGVGGRIIVTGIGFEIALLRTGHSIGLCISVRLLAVRRTYRCGRIYR